MADHNLDLQEIHDFMISIAKKAGEMITAAHPTTESAGNKKNCKYMEIPLVCYTRYSMLLKSGTTPPYESGCNFQRIRTLTENPQPSTS
jgi:hypothetical protein